MGATQHAAGRPRFKAAPLVAVAAFAAISVAAWQVWSVLVVWSAGC